MYSRSFIFALGIVLLALVQDLGRVSGANIATTPGSSPSSTTPVPSTTIPDSGVKRNITAASPALKNATGVHLEEEDDCSDEVPEPEPEGKGNSTDNRQGKQLILGDKDKYEHENATAEAEPEKGTNEKLTGNGTDSTTKSPAHGMASSFTKNLIGYNFGLAVIIAVWLS